jgi:hypothetical protein
VTLQYRILDPEHNVVFTDLDGWLAYWSDEPESASVAIDIVGTARVRVSTVFLRDQNTEAPFETRVFGGQTDGFTLQYATYKLAVEGHRRVVTMVALRATKKPRRDWSGNRGSNGS